MEDLWRCEKWKKGNGRIDGCGTWEGGEMEDKLKKKGGKGKWKNEKKWKVKS